MLNQRVYPIWLAELAIWTEVLDRDWTFEWRHPVASAVRETSWPFLIGSSKWCQIHGSQAWLVRVNTSTLAFSVQPFVTMPTEKPCLLQGTAGVLHQRLCCLQDGVGISAIVILSGNGEQTIRKLLATLLLIKHVVNQAVQVNQSMDNGGQTADCQIVVKSRADYSTCMVSGVL